MPIRMGNVKNSSLSTHRAFYNHVCRFVSVGIFLYRYHFNHFLTIQSKDKRAAGCSNFWTMHFSLQNFSTPPKRIIYNSIKKCCRNILIESSFFEDPLKIVNKE